LLAHAAGFVLVHLLIQFHTRRPANRGLDFLRHYYPILLYSGFYKETGLLNQMLYSGYLDRIFCASNAGCSAGSPALSSWSVSRRMR